jgi:hypothetical protein
LTPGPKPRGKRRTASVPGGTTVTETNGYGELLSPSQLGYNGGLFGMFKGGSDRDAAKFTSEPPRASLTEPPPGYQTPSPDHPYGLSDRSKAPKANDYMTTHGEVER